MLIGEKRGRLEELTGLPAHKSIDVINGDIIEYPPLSAYASGTAARMIAFLGMYLLQHDLAHITDAQGGYQIDSENLIFPHIGVVLKSRQAVLPKDDYLTLAPDLAVVIKALAEDKRKVRNRVEYYIRGCGTKLIWLVFPEIQMVEVYYLLEEVQEFGIDGVLDGRDVLPGFTLAVKDIFPG